MFLSDFKAAQLPAPRGRSPDPSWLAGTGLGQACYLIGGAYGLAESPGLRLADGKFCIGSNWTLRTLVPSIWHVVDRGVWLSERGNLDRCPESMACVVSKHIFGGGVYSTTHNRLLKMVGSGQRKLCEITVQRRGRGIRLPSGVYRANMEEPYMPEKLTDPYHPGGNSLCFMIQTAHLMGFDPIYAMGFTLESGSPYAFGRTNPVTRKPSFYDGEVPLHWLRWYESHFPGRVRLMPGWSGPVYEVFQTEGSDGAQRRALCGDGSETVSGRPPEPNSDAD